MEYSIPVWQGKMDHRGPQTTSAVMTSKGHKTPAAAAHGGLQEQRASLAWGPDLGFRPSREPLRDLGWAPPPLPPRQR